MAKIPFDIKYRPQIESGEYKVETRDGRPARIICWDLNYGTYVIVAAIQEGCSECSVELYTDKGFYWSCSSQYEYDLLLITPEPEVDLEKEIRSERAILLDSFGPMNGEQSLAIRNFARHFYELGKNAKIAPNE